MSDEAWRDRYDSWKLMSPDDEADIVEVVESDNVDGDDEGLPDG